MKTLKKILLCLLLLIPLNVIAGKEITLKETYPDIGPRTSVPSVDATLYSDYILLDINRYYGSVVVEVENEESGEVVLSEFFVNSRDSFTYDISDMPVGAYNVRLRVSNGVEYYGHFAIDDE